MEEKLQALKDAIIGTFGKNPMACDGILHVRASKYDELASAAQEVFKEHNRLEELAQTNEWLKGLNH